LHREIEPVYAGLKYAGGHKTQKEFMMKNKLLVLAACLAALVFSGCKDEPPRGEYWLEWGSFTTSYSSVVSTIMAQGWAVTSVSDGAYATGGDAQNIYDYCTAGTISYNNGGSDDDSFEGLLGYTDPTYGIGLPDDLKAALATKKDEVPLAGIFVANGDAVVFFVDKF
jgi:hypothetical protein